MAGFAQYSLNKYALNFGGCIALSQGSRTIKCGERLRELGCDVAACITILDREEGGQEAFQSAGINLYPLILRSDVTGE